MRDLPIITFLFLIKSNYQNHQGEVEKKYIYKDNMFNLYIHQYNYQIDENKRVDQLSKKTKFGKSLFQSF